MVFSLQVFPTKTLNIFLIFSMCATCPFRLILLELITLMIFSEVYMLVAWVILYHTKYVLITSLGTTEGN
jgi:hypothetical protein